MPVDIRVALARMQSRRDHPHGSAFAYPQAVRQFNALLQTAKEQYPERADIQALAAFESPTLTRSDELVDTVQRLQDALELEPEKPSDVPLMHPKFGILRAEAQLIADFDAATEDTAGVGLIFFDIDHFKSLNTRYTETIVDRDILIPLQRLLVEIVRHRGYCYSVGGDEFIILLLNSDPSEAVLFGQRLLQNVQDASLECCGESVRLTLSVGVAQCPKDGIALDDVRGKANYAENRAKSNGRNRVSAYE